MRSYFNVITYSEMDDESMFLIFNTILSNFLGSFDASISAHCTVHAPYYLLFIHGLTAFF